MFELRGSLVFSSIKELCRAYSDDVAILQGMDVSPGTVPCGKRHGVVGLKSLLAAQALGLVQSLVVQVNGLAMWVLAKDSWLIAAL